MTAQNPHRIFRDMNSTARQHYIRFSICALLLLHGVTASASRPFIEEEQQRRAIFLRPSMDTPDEQLEYARQLHERGRLRRAQRQYRALVRTWPRAHEAAQAQLGYAQVLQERGKFRRSLEEYNRLEDIYPGRYPHTEVLEELLAMANQLRTQRSGEWLFFPGINRPERALPFLERIVQTGPRWDRAAEAKLALAELQEEMGDLEYAVLTYERLERRHRGAPEAITAAFRRGHLLAELSTRHSRHVDGMETAYIALGLAVQQFPRDERADAARLAMLDLRARMATAAFDKAVFYDRTMRNPQAAVITYEQFLANFPNSEHVEKARQRLAELRANMENDDA